MEQDRNQDFQQIYEMYQAPMRTIAKRCGVAYDDIEDVIQETFASYYQAYMRGEGGVTVGSIKAMLVKILKRKCIDLYRKNCRYGKISIETEDGKLPPEVIHRYVSRDVSDVVIDKYRYREIRKIIDEMKPDWRDVVYYCCVLDYSPAEASELLGISGTACRSRLMRARIYLKKKLGPEYFPQLAEQDSMRDTMVSTALES